MAERDMERAEVAKATSHAGEMEQEISLLRDDQEQVSDTHEPPVDLILHLELESLLIDSLSILCFFIQC